jgi:hypothetical protein
MRLNLRNCLQFCLCLLSLVSAGVHATPETEEAELKAAFVYNFTLFTNWPQQHEKKLYICLLGEISYASELNLYDGRSVNGATLKIAQVKSLSEAQSCQVLIPEIKDQAYINRIKKELNGLPTLIIAESGNYSPDSAHIMMIKNNNRIEFDVNQTEAKISNLSFSFKLLKLAHKVY